MATATYHSFLIGYALLAAALLAGLYLFFSLKRDIQIAARHQDQLVQAIAERLQQAEQPLLLEAGAMDSGAMAYPSSSSSVRAGFNLNKRVQAMRLLRRGEDVSHIAAALAVPRKEVELLIRVQQMTGVAPAPQRPVFKTVTANSLRRANSAAVGSGGDGSELSSD